MESPTLERKTPKQLINIINEERQIKTYNDIKPYLVRLFTHTLLLYISISAYLNFESSQVTYQSLIDLLKKDTVSDVKLMNDSEACPINYTQINPFTIPPFKSGCRCDNQIYTQDVCKYIYNSTKGYSSIWSENCEYQNTYMDNKGDPSKLPPTPKNQINKETKKPLRQLWDFTVFPQYKENCSCYQNITSNNKEYTINTIFPGKKICIKFSNINTIDYFKTINIECDVKNRCQKYFCKKDNSPHEECPKVDLFFDNIITNQSDSYNSTLVYFNESWSNLNVYSEYNRSNLGIDDYIKKVYSPITNINITMEGLCNNDNTLKQTLYALMNRTECSLETRNYITSKRNMTTVLKANKIYNEISNSFPLFNISLSNDNYFSLELEYAIYRDTPSCLVKNLNFLNKNLELSVYEGQSDYDKTKEKFKKALLIFISIDNTFETQMFFQYYLLCSNCFTVLFNVFIILFRLYKLFQRNEFYGSCILYYEVYISFFIDILSAIVGGIGFFILKDYYSLIDELTETNCFDNFVEYRLNSYSNDLYSTADSNFQVFIIMIIKIFLISLNVLVYVSIKKCKIKKENICKIIYESIHEGDEDDTPLSSKEVDEEIRKSEIPKVNLNDNIKEDEKQIHINNVEVKILDNQIKDENLEIRDKKDKSSKEQEYIYIHNNSEKDNKVNENNDSNNEINNI